MYVASATRKQENLIREREGEKSQSEFCPFGDDIIIVYDYMAKSEIYVAYDKRSRGGLLSPADLESRFAAIESYRAIITHRDLTDRRGNSRVRAYIARVCSD